jgi:nickel-dependent lactate racemase
MPAVAFLYGKETVQYAIPENRFKGELVSQMHHYKAGSDGETLVAEALENPIGTPKLSVMAEGKQDVVVIASDHTRPVPSKIIMPRLLAEIRKGSPDARVTILISTGCHRQTTKEELISKFGPEIVREEHIVIHDCDAGDLVNLGKLPSGGNMILNRLAVEADLLVAEGFIEPHCFAGFSGGRKSVLPGIAGRETVVYNHNAEFVAHPRARSGILDGNPIHDDMLYAARAARLAFICNVVINSNKEIVYAVAGDLDVAHRDGCNFLANKCQALAVPADIAISSGGGFPLDQNIYQSVKGMLSGVATVNEGGVVIMLAKANEGHGGEEFYKTFAEEKDLERLLDTFMKTPKHETRVDQWSAQLFVQILRRARVIYVSVAPDALVEEFHMIPAHSLEEAVKKAEALLGNSQATITAIPDGLAVMVVSG